MKIKIDKDGYLWLERAGVMKKQYCPHDPDLQMCCGDWCPLYGEPLNDGGGIMKVPPTVFLQLCWEKFLSCAPSNFTDERGGK